MRFAPSFVHLYIQTLPKFQNLPKLKSTNKPLFISILALTYSHISFVLCSSFLRHLFVICSSFVRHSFVIRSSFVRHSFVIRSSFVRLLFVIRSSFVRHSFVFCSSFLHLTFPLLHSLSLGEGWGEDILFVFSLSVCRATTARVARTVFPISFSQINH